MIHCTLLPSANEICSPSYSQFSYVSTEGIYVFVSKIQRLSSEFVKFPKIEIRDPLNGRRTRKFHKKNKFCSSFK